MTKSWGGLHHTPVEPWIGAGIKGVGKSMDDMGQATPVAWSSWIFGVFEEQHKEMEEIMKNHKEIKGTHMDN